MSQDDGLDADCSTNCEEVARLKKLVKLYQPKIPYPCPDCGTGQSLCSTKDGGILVHNCIDKKYTVRPKPLKKGQKSILTNAVGGED